MKHHIGPYYLFKGPKERERVTLIKAERLPSSPAMPQFVRSSCCDKLRPNQSAAAKTKIAVALLPDDPSSKT